MALNSVTLTGTLPGAPRALAVFTPSNWLTASADDELIPPAPVPVTLSSGGAFSVSLLATDNADLPSGWYWTVNLSGIPQVAAYSFSFYLAYASGATQDISSLATLPSPVPIGMFLPLPSGTAAAGDAPVATGSGEASAWGPVPRVVAATGAGGFALQNGTPTIISWTAPSDGAAHFVSVLASLYVSSAETGGEIDTLLTLPDGQAYQVALYNPNLGGPGPHGLFDAVPSFAIQAGSTINVVQGSALTGGAAVLWAQMWGA